MEAGRWTLDTGAHRISRRALLRSAALGGSGLLAAYLVGCGDGDEAGPAPTATAGVWQPPTATAAPAVLRWRPLTPSGALPPPRRDHSLVTDGERLILFGGRGPNPLGDTWVYAIASNQWEQVQTIGVPVPPVRFGHNAVWDRASNRIILFGGQAEATTFFNDLWAFDPEFWRWSQTSLPAGAPTPSPRYGAGAALDPTGRLLMTHGFTTSGRFDDTWQYGLGEQAWAEITPGTERPVERCLMRAVWDPRQQRLFIFGGQTNEQPFLGDLWSLFGDDWRQLTRTPAPSARNLYAMIFDEEAFRILLFGGRTESGPVNDLWAFDAGSERWDQLSVDGDSPSARFGHDAVWLADRRTLLMFGGNDGDTDLNDLWELSTSA